MFRNGSKAADDSGLGDADAIEAAMESGGRHICLLLAQLATYLVLLEDGDFSIDRWFHGGGRLGTALFLTASAGTARQYEGLVQHWFEKAINAYDLPAFHAHGKVWFVEGMVHILPIQLVSSARNRHLWPRGTQFRSTR